MIDAARVRQLVTIVQSEQTGPAVNAAVAELVSGFSRYVSARHAKRIDRDELDQIAALSIWRAAKRFDLARGVASFATFAYTVTSRAVIDHLRRQATRDGRTAGMRRLTLDAASDSPANCPDPLADWTAAELRGEIFGLLSPDESAVLAARLDGLSPPAIAERCGIPLWRAKALIGRIVDKVRKHQTLAAA